MNCKNLKCVNIPIGKNSISEIPKTIAAYLKLPQVERYTGHSFRRTSATIAADHGADTLDLKRLGGWQSSTVAEGYVNESLHHKRKLNSIISGSAAAKKKKSAPATVTTTFLQTLVNDEKQQSSTETNTINLIEKTPRENELSSLVDQDAVAEGHVNESLHHKRKINSIISKPAAPRKKKPATATVTTTFLQILANDENQQSCTETNMNNSIEKTQRLHENVEEDWGNEEWDNEEWENYVNAQLKKIEKQHRPKAHRTKIDKITFDIWDDGIEELPIVNHNMFELMQLPASSQPSSQPALRDTINQPHSRNTPAHTQTQTLDLPPSTPSLLNQSDASINQSPYNTTTNQALEYLKTLNISNCGNVTINFFK